MKRLLIQNNFKIVKNMSNTTLVQHNRSSKEKRLKNHLIFEKSQNLITKTKELATRMISLTQKLTFSKTCKKRLKTQIRVFHEKTALKRT